MVRLPVMQLKFAKMMKGSLVWLIHDEANCLYGNRQIALYSRPPKNDFDARNFQSIEDQYLHHYGRNVDRFWTLPEGLPCTVMDAVQMQDKIWYLVLAKDESSNLRQMWVQAKKTWSVEPVPANSISPQAQISSFP